MKTSNKVVSVKKLASKKYPKAMLLKRGLKTEAVKLPSKKQFGQFCMKHGCSLEATSVALSLIGVNKNPYELYLWARKNLPGNNGSKISIYGTAKIINHFKKNSAKWYPITASNKKSVIAHIRKEVKQGNIVLFEQANPIHTVLFVGRWASNAKKLAMQTYNNVYATSVTEQVMNKSLKGSSNPNIQSNFYRGATRSAGYVVVKN